LSQSPSIGGSSARSNTSSRRWLLALNTSMPNTYPLRDRCM
jgi:hypothetical protein